MNIVFTHHPAHHTLNGVGVAAISTQLNASLWQPARKPVFDMMEEKKPSYLFCTLTDITPVLLAAVEEYRVRIILFADGVPTNLSSIGQPFLQCYSENISDIARKNLDSSTAIQINKAANYAQYKKGVANNQDSSDIFYLSNSNLQLEQQEILSAAIRTGHQFKVCGNTVLPLAQFLGKASIYSISNLIASSKVCLDFNKNSLYDILANGSVPLSNVEHPFFNSYKNIDDFTQMLNDLIKAPKLRKKIVKVAKKMVLKDHTYYNRLKAIGHFINEQEIVDMSELAIERIVCD